MSPPVQNAIAGHLKLNVRRLLQLLQVVESGSINKAASELRITQPALTRSLRALEESLGLLLLDRTAKGVVPTPYGELLLSHARIIRANLNSAATDIESMSDPRGTSLRAGVTSGVCWILMRAVDRLQASKPDLIIKTIEAHTVNLLAQLRLGEIDVAICPATSTSEPDLEKEPLFTQEFCLWVRSSHPLLGKKRLTLSDLANETWIVPQRDSVLRTRLEAAFAREKVTLTGPIIECSSHLMILELLAASDRIALLSRMTLDVGQKVGLFERLEGEFQFTNQMYTRFLRRGAHAPATRDLTDTLRQIATEAGLKWPPRSD
jgi:DNA-binding transcriptional LysR family regulator